MKKAIWISYDLGIKGDYQGLYSWLDDRNAVECGNNVAFLHYEYKNNLISELKDELNGNIDFKKGDRIYLVRKEIIDGKTKIRGKFIIGKRKSNPWEGYGSSHVDIVDGDE